MTEYEIPKDMNPLPKNIDWNELNTFLNDKVSNFHHMNDENYFDIHNDDWKILPSFVNANLSDTSVKVLDCLHNDIKWFYGNLVLKTASKEVMALRMYIQDKYIGLDKMTFTDTLKIPYIEQIYKEFGFWRR